MSTAPGPTPAELGVLLSAYAARGEAAKVRRRLDKVVGAAGGEALDNVVLKVNGKGRAGVYDPRRTLAGTLTPALTWGIFGLLAGGISGLLVWAIVGAICGGLYAYFFEHLASKEQLGRIGRELPAGSSALVAYVAECDTSGLLKAAVATGAATASVATVSSDLTAVVDSVPPNPAPEQSAGVLTMIIARFVGERGARDSLGDAIPAKQHDKNLPLIELFIESNDRGRRRVSDPTQSGTAFSIPDAIGWAAFGLVWGLIVGSGSGGGVLSFIESGVIVGVLWGIFGLVAGTLYGMWAGRAVSARRLRAIGPVVSPDTSVVVAWADGRLDDDAIARWAAGSSGLLCLRFVPVKGGAALAV